MGIPITINGRELNANDMNVEPNAEYTVTVGDDGTVNVERTDLKTENVKLRELLKDMWRFTGAVCKKYPRLFDPLASGGQMVQLNALESFEQRMQELGIEAN